MTIGEIEEMARRMIEGKMPPAAKEPIDYAHTWVAIRLAVPLAIEAERERCAKIAEEHGAIHHSATGCCESEKCGPVIALQIRLP